MLALILLLGPAGPLQAMGTRPKIPIVPKWGRFEQAFTSSAHYNNPLQDATLTVVFISPLGETIQVYGFWDGGDTWRVRFSPNQPGRWTYRTICSDTGDAGLHQQNGQFLCTAATGITRFERHGPLQVSRDRRHFVHADGVPFFWLADTVWNGARVSVLKDWQHYAGIRGSQGFSAAQWSVAPGRDEQQDAAYLGFPDRIAINPEFFKRLDAKVETLERVGILNVIAPLAELESQNAFDTLPDDQAALLVRYVVARWQGDPVVWLLALDADTAAKRIGRWKRIGQSVFGGKSHAPVLLYPGGAYWVFDEFRDQTWVDAFACQAFGDMSEDGLKFAFAGPLSKQWTNGPARPLIPFLPRENGMDLAVKKRFSGDDVRHAAYWSLLLAPPAGLSYSAQGVADWDVSVTPQADNTKGADWPLWQKCLFLPAAKQMTRLVTFADSLNLSRLRPCQQLVATQPGDSNLSHYVAAAAADKKDLALVYAPEEHAVNLALDKMPPSPSVTWFNPRTSQTLTAVGVVGANSCQFPVPAPGDWLLTVKAGK